MEASRGCEAPLVEKKNCSREVEHAKGKVREICVCGDRLCVRLRGKKTWTKWGLNPRPHATGLTMRHHELAKQARYHCAIRPLVVILEVKNSYGPCARPWRGDQGEDRVIIGDSELTYDKSEYAGICLSRPYFFLLVWD